MSIVFLCGCIWAHCTRRALWPWYSGWAVWLIFFAQGGTARWFAAGFATCMAIDELFDAFAPKVFRWLRRMKGSRT